MLNVAKTWHCVQRKSFTSDHGSLLRWCTSACRWMCNFLLVSLLLLLLLLYATIRDPLMLHFYAFFTVVGFCFFSSFFPRWMRLHRDLSFRSLSWPFLIMSFCTLCVHVTCLVFTRMSSVGYSFSNKQER